MIVASFCTRRLTPPKKARPGPGFVFQDRLLPEPAKAEKTQQATEGQQAKHW